METGKFYIGDISVDPAACEVSRNGVVGKLSPRAMAVLERLAAQPGEVVTLEILLRELWPRTVTSSNAVHKVVSELRRAMGGALETIPRRGYRLIVAKTPISSGTPRATRLTMNARSALLLAASRSRSAVERDLVDEIHREIVMGLTQMDPAKVRVEADGAECWSDYKVDLDVREIQEQLLVTVQITPASNELPGHIQHFESPESRIALVLTEAVTQTVHDLVVMLDEDHLRQMREWGTRSVRAYKYALKGIQFSKTATAESISHAADNFRLAIDADPRFSQAYRWLGDTYAQLALDAGSSRMRDDQRLKLHALANEAAAACVDPKVVDSLKRSARFASLSNPTDAAAFWHGELLENPTDVDALVNISLLLMGAKLVDEAQRYLDRALSQELSDDVRVSHSAWYGSIAEARGDTEEHLRINKDVNLAIQPDLTTSLYGTVRALGKLGRFQEAMTYIDRLMTGTPRWGKAAKAVLCAQRGDTPRGSTELQMTLADAKLSNAAKGEIAFMVGDVENGVRYHQRIGTTALRLYWSHGPGNERYYPDAVVRDPRYQALLEELGIGRTWRAHMRERAQSLAQITGIEVTTPVPAEDVNQNEV